MAMVDTTVFVIDDDSEVCKALRWLFESVDIKVETYNDPKSYLDKIDAKRRGCLIIDVRMPMMSGLELIEHLRSQKINIPVIMITGHGDVPMAVRAMKAGAVDFILKPINHQYLLEITQKALQSPIVDTQLADNIEERINRLTDRERQVMALVLDGKLNKEIAYELNVSISTVEAHRARVMQKMEAKSLTHLVKLNLQHNPTYING